MIPDRIAPDMDAERICLLSSKWRVDPIVMYRLSLGCRRLSFGIEIISGYRTEEEQNALRDQGRPTAPNDQSTHLSCPATGVDVRMVGMTPTNVTKALLGSAMMEAGLRWGGGSKVDPETGIPSDWNHFDLGPRR